MQSKKNSRRNVLKFGTIYWAWQTSGFLKNFEPSNISLITFPSIRTEWLVKATQIFQSNNTHIFSNFIHNTNTFIHSFCAAASIDYNLNYHGNQDKRKSWLYSITRFVNHSSRMSLIVNFLVRALLPSVIDVLFEFTVNIWVASNFNWF